MERAGRALGRWLGENLDWSEEEREIAQFSLTLLMSSAYFLSLLTLLGWAMGVLGTALAAAFSSGVLRTFAGGAHLSTGWRCGTVSSVLICLAAWCSERLGPTVAGVPLLFWIATPAVAALVAAVMARRAPVDVPEKPITSTAQRARLRKLAIATPLIWGVFWCLMEGFGAGTAFGGSFYALWIASSAGLAWETFSVVPPGMRFVHRLDAMLGRVTHRLEKGGEAR